jgi:hypothetical protein
MTTTRHDTTIKRPDGCCTPFCALGTLLDRGNRCSLRWCQSCADGIAKLLSSYVRLVVNLLAWAQKSKRAGLGDVGVRTREHLRARRLHSTDQGKGGSDVDADADS